MKSLEYVFAAMVVIGLIGISVTQLGWKAGLAMWVLVVLFFGALILVTSLLHK